MVDDPKVSARHCAVVFEGGFWRLRDLGSEHGTRVNGTALVYPRALFRGDVIELGTTALRFDAEPPADDPALMAAIASAPDAPESWLVYSDWLLDRSDPLGERMARAYRGERVDHLPWLGPLWDAFVGGELEIEWHFGFIKRASVRPVVGHLPIDWQDAVSTLLGLRVGQLTRELIIDVPGLRVGPSVRPLDDVREAQTFLANLPKLPPSLTRVTLGYLVSDSIEPRVQVTEALAMKVPPLRGTEVFTVGRKARLRQLTLEPGLKCLGVTDGVRALTDVTRLRRGSKTQLHFETPPGIPFIADGNPCHFAQTDGRWRLIAGRLKGEIRVNGRVDSVYWLLPGDVIDIQAGGKFQFEVVS